MHYDTSRRCNRKCHRVGNGMVDMNCFNRKSPQFDDISRHKPDQFCLTGQAVFLQLSVDQAERQPCAVNRDIDTKFF